MMQPTPMAALPRRKRKRPVSVKTEEGQWSSETEDERAPARRKTQAGKKKLQQPEAVECKAENDPAEATRAEEPTTQEAPAPLDRPFRGKCLYQSRKCENERALKRNGKAHNLCDEHRSKQNQHQRKFDAKKYSKRKNDGSSGDEEDGHENEQETTRDDEKTGSATASRVKASDAPNAAKDVPRPTIDKDPRRLETKSLSEGAATTLIRQYAYTSESMPPPRFHGASHLDPHRPPPLQVVRTPPASFGSQPPPPNAEVYSASELLAAGMLVPPHGQLRPTVYASPRGAVTPFAMLPRPSIRSQSFDSGITRISPVGGAAMGGGGLRPFDRQQQFFHEQDQYQHHRHHQQPITPSLAPSHGVTSPKLPSLQQLPLAQPTYAASRGIPLSAHNQRHSPAHGHSQFRNSPPYYASQGDPRHAMLQPPPPPARGPLLPPLAPLLQPPPQHNRSPPAPPGYRPYPPNSYEGSHQ